MKVSELFSTKEAITPLGGGDISGGNPGGSDGKGGAVCACDRLTLVRHKINRNRHVNFADRRRWNAGGALGRVTVAITGSPDAAGAYRTVSASDTNAQVFFGQALVHLITTYGGGELILKPGVYTVDSSGVASSQPEIAAINISGLPDGSVVTIRGEDAVIKVKDNTLAAGRTFHLVRADTENLIISGITIEGNQANNEGDVVGVYHLNTKITTEDMTINDCKIGIHACSSFGTIVSNDIYNCEVGVKANSGAVSADNCIADNVIVNCATGVLADGTRTVVKNNTFVKDKYADGEYSIHSVNSINVLAANNDCGTKEPVFEAGAAGYATELPAGKVY